MRSVYLISLLSQKTFISENKEIYHDGVKICDNFVDYNTLKLTISAFSEYIKFNKNLDEEILHDFSVKLIDREINYRCHTIDNCFSSKVKLDFSIRREDSRKFLCIKINKNKYFIPKIKLDILLKQLDIFEKDIYNKNSFKKVNYIDIDNDFLLDIGELNSLVDHFGVSYV